MGVRLIGYRFVGDYKDLDAALDHVEARIKGAAGAAGKVSVEAAAATTRSIGGIQHAATAAVKASALVVEAEKRTVDAVQAHTKARQASAAAAVKAGEAEARAAAAVTAANAGTGSNDEQKAARRVAIAEAAAAKRAAAEASVAVAAEAAAAKEVQAAQAAAAKEVAASEAAIRRIAGLEAAAYREQAQRTKQAADLEKAAVDKRARASSDVGGKLLFAGGVTAAGIGVAVKAFADFDKTMSAVQAATDSTGASLDQLRDAAIKAGAATQYSATQAAEGEVALGKAGVATKDILSGGLVGALNLAAAGQIDVGQAAEIAATAMTQFNLQGKDIPHVADLLAAGAGKAQGEVTDLANALKFVGPVANGLNIPLEQTVGVLAELASKGIIGEQAGTSTRGFLLSLTAPSHAAATELESLGISLYDAQGKFVGFNGAADQLRAGLGGLNEQARNAALGVIFGNEQITAARILYDGGAQAVDGWTKKVNDSGFAARQASDLTNNLSGDLERLRGSFETDFIKSGSGANGFLRGLTQDATSAVNAFGALPDEAQHVALGFTAIAAAAALTGGAMLVLLPRIAATRVALAELGVTSAGSSRALAVGGTALAGYIAVSAGLSAIAPDFDKAAVSTEHFADALNSLQHGGAAVDVGAFGKNFDQLGKQLHDLSDPSLTARFEDATFAVGGLLHLGGSTDGRFDRQEAIADFKNLDKTLTELVNNGQGQEAAAQFAALNKQAVAGGAGVNQLANHLPQFTAAMDAARSATGAGAGKVDAFGNAASGAAIKAQALATQIAAAAKAAEDATRKAFAKDADVLSNYDPAQAGKAEDASTAATERLGKARQHLQDVEDRLAARKKGASAADKVALREAQQSVDAAAKSAGKAAKATGGTSLAAAYKQTIEETKQFTVNVQKAIAAGLDPRYVEQLLEEGPKKAGPILAEMVSDHSGRLIKMVNSSEKTLARLGDLAAEQARLTATAIASGTDDLTHDLSKALRVAAEISVEGAKATSNSVAKALHLPAGTVEKIASEFGITLINGVQAEVNKRKIQLRAKAKLDFEIETSEHRKGERDTTYHSPAPKKVPQSTTHHDYATGGLLQGPGTKTSDSIPIWGSTGEFMQPAHAVDFYGVEFMEDIRRRRLPRFAGGGLLGAGPALAAIPGPRAALAARAAGPVVVRVPVHETHTRTIQVGDVNLTARNPREFQAWAEDQQRRAERAFS